jgi:serine/threonine protein kinase
MNKGLIYSLNIALRKYCGIDISEELKGLSEDYDEPWHEEAVKEFGSEPISEEEYAEQNIYQKKINTHFFELRSQIDHLIDKHNIKLISEGIKDNIGVGAYGIVYSVIYNGKNCAMKVYQSEWSDDADIWINIFEKTKNASPEFKKYLPTIYLHDKYNGASIMIMEKLRPMPKSIRFVHNHKNCYLSDENIKDIVLELLAYNDTKMLDMKRYTYIPIQNKDDFFPGEDQIVMVLSKFKNDEKVFKLSSVKESINDLYRNHLNKNSSLLSYDKKDIMSSVDDAAYGILYKVAAFPTSSREIRGRKTNSISPRLIDFFEFLKELTSLGITFGDLHSDNIMIGENDHFKIIDVGMFKA